MPGHWILYDGDCGLCRRAAAWVARRDRREQFLVAPYQDAPAPPITPELRAACAETMHVVTQTGRILRAGRACLFILERLGWGCRARLLALPPFVWMVEMGYRFVARNRPFFARFLFRQ